jgi:hypothetical protein
VGVECSARRCSRWAGWALDGERRGGRAER